MPYSKENFHIPTHGIKNAIMLNPIVIPWCCINATECMWIVYDLEKKNDSTTRTFGTQKSKNKNYIEKEQSNCFHQKGK